jgi:ribonuclease P protein component
MRRALRLTQRRDFASVYRRGRQYRGDLLVLRVLKTDHSMPRFGFTASAAIGNAVARNRLKRRLREAVRSLEVAPGWDIVVNSRRGAAEASYEQLRGELCDLFARAGVLQGAAS